MRHPPDVVGLGHRHAQHVGRQACGRGPRRWGRCGVWGEASPPGSMSAARFVAASKSIGGPQPKACLLRGTALLQGLGGPGPGPRGAPPSARIVSASRVSLTREAPALGLDVLCDAWQVAQDAACVRRAVQCGGRLCGRTWASQARLPSRSPPQAGLPEAPSFSRGSQARLSLFARSLASTHELQTAPQSLRILIASPPAPLWV